MLSDHLESPPPGHNSLFLPPGKSFRRPSALVDLSHGRVNRKGAGCPRNTAPPPAEQGLLYFIDMERLRRASLGVTGGCGSCPGARCQPCAVPAARPGSSGPSPKRPQTDSPEERAQHSQGLFSLLVEEKRNLVSILCFKSKICHKSTSLKHPGPRILPKRV